MSQTQYVEYANRGFWAYDVALGIFLKYLIDAAEKSDQGESAWLSTAILSWREVICFNYGLTLDPDWSAAQKQAFIALAEDACARLAKTTSISLGEIVSWPILDDMRIDTRGAAEVHTAPVVELGRAIVELVTGELPEEPDGNFWFYGTPSGRQTLRRSPD
jgi:hypothetical protein